MYGAGASLVTFTEEISMSERTAWLRARYNELEAESLCNWDNSGGSVCTGAGGQWSGVSCYTPSGRSFDSTQGRAH